MRLTLRSSPAVLVGKDNNFGHSLMNAVTPPRPTLLAVGALLMALPGLAAAQATLQGNIISHEGNQLVVRTGDIDTTVMLTGSTRIQAITGLLGKQREDQPPNVLIRGLAVNVETVPNGAGFDAASVTFKPGDLRTAKAIGAGIEQPRQRLIAAQTENERRLAQIGQFTERASTRVFFATGSAAISAEGKEDLLALADQASAIPGYLLRVVGHTDTTGSAAANQRLSAQRASAVTAYLVRNGKVPPEKIMSPAALGSEITDTGDGPSSNAQNRRVTVSILVAKASEGISSIPPR